jgi:glycosyltransferase involved in cell wall biosynthesis
LKLKNIVILIDWFLPGNKAGGPVKSVFSMLNLLKPYFNFSVITTNRDLGALAPYKNIKPNCWTEYNGIPVYYFSKDQLKSNTLLNVINSREPDVLYLNSFWSYYFSLLPLRFEKAGKLKCDVVLAPRGMLGKGALSIKPLKKKLFLSLLKFVNLHAKVVFHATTTDEEKEVRSFLKKAEVKIAPNLNVTPLLTSRSMEKKEGQVKLFYLSRISKVKNLHFALEILSKLKVSGEIIYDIYGSIEDKAYWNSCKEIIKHMPSNIKVNYKGELSFEAVQAVIADYHFLFLPTLNENFGHSIAETLKSGCPVIISKHTPWTKVNEHKCGFALDLKHPPEFKKALTDILAMDNSTYSGMSENCLKFMKQNTDNSKDIAAYQNLFN